MKVYGSRRKVLEALSWCSFMYGAPSMTLTVTLQQPLVEVCDWAISGLGLRQSLGVLYDISFLHHAGSSLK